MERISCLIVDTEFMQCQTYSVGGSEPDDRLTPFLTREQYDALVASIG